MHLEAVAQHQLDREQHRERVRDPLPGDVGRRAVARLVERGAVAERGARKHAERTGEHRGLVGQDVAEHVLGDHDVELARRADELHRRVVDELVDELDVGVLGGVQAVYDLAPQPGRLEHVGLVDAVDLVAARAGGVERDARDALDLELAVHHRVVGAHAGSPAGCRALDVGLAGTIAEVQSAGELAHDEHVDALEELGLER